MLNQNLWLSGVVIVTVCAGTVYSAHRVTAGQARALTDQARSIADLEARIARMAQDPSDAGLEHAIESLEAMRQRLEALERAPRRPALPGVDADPTAEVPEQTSRTPDGLRNDPPSSAHGPDLQEELGDLLERVLSPGMDLSGSPEDKDRFWELIKDTDVVDECISRLEAQLVLDPDNVGLRMSLADTYIAKLFSVPSGPEQGRWGGRAEAQWREVLELDPEHWEAQFTLSNNHAYYPDVMGMTGQAISGLERARRIQERSAPTDEHVQTYLSLARLYQRTNKIQEALEAVQAGLLHHPSDERLLAVLTELEER